MNALKPRAPFQVLVMSEESRLGREAIETAYALKQLVQTGVRVFFYLEDRERTLDSPTDKIMRSLTTFADELEREKARQRTYDAMQRKAKAGHVTGGRVFGYDNVEIVGANGGRRVPSGKCSSGRSTAARSYGTNRGSGTPGSWQRSERPEDAWLCVPAPELRIVSPDLCAASQRERGEREAQYSMGERSYRASSYLLSGLRTGADCSRGTSTAVARC
jgi:Resolvase, N terminal domain